MVNKINIESNGLHKAAMNSAQTCVVPGAGALTITYFHDGRSD